MGQGALKDLKVVDFGWLFTVPIATKYLADHGATVVKVESVHRIDPIRTFLPMADDISGVDRSIQFANWNDSKYSLALNLKHPMSAGIIRGLVKWADVVVENYTPGAMDRMGLSYEELKKIKPDIIMVRASLEGQEGPWARRSALGIVLQALAGLVYQVGWPDRTPVQIPLALTDFTAAEFTIITVLAALDYRRRTGKGQCFDLSQHETAEHLLLPEILDYAANHRIKERDGNHSRYAAPHNIYRCQGDDRWCAITVFSDEEWRSLCQVMGEPEMARDPRFVTRALRKQNEAVLDDLVGAWTAGYPAEALVARLQSAGVAAGLAANSADLNLDPQLKYHGHYQIREHPEVGQVVHELPPFRLSATPAEVKMTAPCLGEHTDLVCREILGISEEEFLDFYQQGVFE